MQRDWGSDGIRLPEVDAILRELGGRVFDSMEDVQAYLDERMRVYNASPQPELGGLSPLQMGRLLGGDWLTSGALRLERDLPLEELSGSEIFTNARTMLAALRDEGPAKATAAGNLSRAFVNEMLTRMRWPAGFVEEVRRHSKVINEQDVLPLDVLRHVLQFGGLIRRHGGFRITRAGRELLEDARAGELYARLFITFFREFDLSALDWLPPHPGLQHTIAFAFYILSRDASSWTRPQDLAQRVWLEHVADRPTAAELEFPEMAHWRTASRLLHPLTSFGLLERRDLPATAPYEHPFEVRKTPLYDRFMRFDFEQELAAVPSKSTLRLVR